MRQVFLEVVQEDSECFTRLETDMHYGFGEMRRPKQYRIRRALGQRNCESGAPCMRTGVE